MYPPPIQNLINAFAKFPGIGPRQAARMVFYLLNEPEAARADLAGAVVDIASLIITCRRCGNIESKEHADNNACSICTDKKRDQERIAIVETVTDLRAIERTRTYGGLYHVLGGGIGASKSTEMDVSRAKQCIERIVREKPTEVIIATSPTYEGDATARYLERELPPKMPGTKLTRLARGLSKGVDLEYVDDETLREALAGRR
ncbi:MAG: recombination mediator RecR [bacterium]|nr:recombination mediator RecR [bacterium]